MTRTKQQRPRHIKEQKSDEDAVDENEIPSGNEFSSTESTLSSMESDVKPEDEPSESATPSPHSLSRTPTRNDVSCPKDSDEAPAEYESDRRSHHEENDCEPCPGTRTGERNENHDQTPCAPFVNIQRAPWNEHRNDSLRHMNGGGRNGVSDYAELLKSVMSQNMRERGHAGVKNGIKNSPLPREDCRNGAVLKNGHTEWAALLQSMMANPIHLMAKFFYDSHHKNGQINGQETLLEDREISQHSSTAVSDSTTLNAIRNHILDKRNNRSDEEKKTLLNGNSHDENGRHFSSESEQGQLTDERFCSTNEAFASTGNKMFRPFLSIREMISGRSDRKENLKNHKHENGKLDTSGIKDFPPRFPPVAWPGIQPIVAPSNSNGLVKQRIPTDNLEELRPRSTENEKSRSQPSQATLDLTMKPNHTVSDVAANSKFESVPVEMCQKGLNRSPENTSRRYKSPSPHWIAQRKVSPYQRYPTKVGHNGTTESREHFPRPYGYPPLTVAPHGPFSLPLGPLPDYPSMTAPPYYNPWGMMYPPLHPGIERMPANALFQTLHPDIHLLRNTPVSNRGSPPGPMPHRSSSNSPYQSSIPSSRKPGPSRTKVQPANPIDTLHAAIVREAKEMNKGMDPENMYIECPICHKKIKRLYHFQRHMRIHSGEKSHVCPFCPYKSVRKDNLKSHMKTHEKPKYDGSRRVEQQRRENTVRPTFPSRPEFHISADKAVAGSPPNPTERSPPFLALRPNREIHTTVSPPLRHPTTSSDKILEFIPHHLAIRNMGLLSPGSYLPSGKRSFPYNGYPFIPPFLHFTSRDKEDESPASPSCIREIDDRRGSTDSDSMADVEKENDSCDSIGVKTFKIDPGNTEDSVLLGNSNNSNNLAGESLQIYSPSETDYSKVLAKESSPGFYENGIQKSLPHKFGNQKDFSGNVLKRPCESNILTTLTRQNGEFQEIPHQSTTLGIHNFAPEKPELINQGRENKRKENGFVHDGGRRLPKERKCDGPETTTSWPATKSLPDQSSKNMAPNLSTIFHPVATACQKSDFEIKKDVSLVEDYDMDIASSAVTTIADVKAAVSPTSEVAPRCNGSVAWMTSSRESKCRLCDFIAPSNSSLQEHMTSHKEDGLYKCQQCDYHGKNLSKLIEHIRIHTGERPFQCDQCSYAAKRKDNLAQHKSVRHDKNRFKGPTRVLKLSNQHEYQVPQKIPSVGTSMRRDFEYYSMELGRVASPPEAQTKELPGALEKKLPLPRGAWFAKIGDRELSSRLTNRKHSAGSVQNGISDAKDLPNLLNPHAYSHNMTPSFVYGHPLMTTSLFSSFPSLPTGENRVNNSTTWFSPPRLDQ